MVCAYIRSRRLQSIFMKGREYEIETNGLSKQKRHGPRLGCPYVTARGEKWQFDVDGTLIMWTVI